MPHSVTARSNRVRRVLSHLQARQHQQAGHVVWVYAITDALTPDQLNGLTGVGSERVRAVTEGGLTAVVGSVDARAFGEQARAGLLADLASIERLGRAHHQVIACVAADGPVLPLRLATVYPDDQTVAALLGRSSAEFVVMLEAFRGTEEWGVKIYLGGPDATAAQDPHAEPGNAAAGTPEPPPNLAGSSLDEVTSRAAGPGWREAIMPRLAAEDAEGFVEMIDLALSGIAVASRRHAAEDGRLPGSEGWLAVNAAYLVNSERAGEFTAVARALGRSHEGMRAELTGPWPPYSFADLYQG